MTKAISKKNSLSHKKFHFVKGRTEKNLAKLFLKLPKQRSKIFNIFAARVLHIFIKRGDVKRERMFVQFLTYITSTTST